ncbi:MAG: MBL fold metallo-hydrolase [Porphyromonadaceae bacterium]|nr:MBL fold metallo-hydrolase [Porphyromonadaceae bacterium]
MRLIVLGSSSSGNSYLLDSGREVLLLECGLPIKKIKQALGYDLSRLCGALVSHEHGDHARCAREIAEAYIPTYMSRGTAEALGLEGRAKTLMPMQMVRIGEFKVIGFNVKHDCREPFGFLIDHPDMGTMAFATDTYYLPNRFRGLSHLMIECNYRADILQRNVDEGIVSVAQYNRTLQSHMSYETCLEALAANDLSQVHNIVLIHLSPTNSSADEFERGVREATGKIVSVAKAGLELNFNKTPF